MTLLLTSALAAGLGLAALPLLTSTSPTALANFLPQIGFTLFLHSDNVITPSVSGFIEKTLASENITGLSVAVIKKDGTPEYHSWGYRTEDGDEMASDVVSKAFCATALGLLIDDFANGRNVTSLPSGLDEITWHTRLSDLVPEWQLMDHWASERANLRDILSHVSGIPRHDYSYGPLDTPYDAVTRLKHLRPAFELREQWSYNNIMFMVAQHIITTYSDQPYTSFVEERIFSPLGMTSSSFSPTEAEASGKFTQGWTKDGRRIPEWFSEEMAVLLAGAGGIISNAIDMSKWISTWIHEGVHGNHTVFPQSVYQNVSYSYSIATDHPTDSEQSIVGYGMGWFRSSYRGHDVVYHQGAIPGLSTLVSFLPSDELGVTIFANGGDKAEPVMLILNRILDEALRLRASSHSPSPLISNTTTLPSTDSLTLSLDDLAGTYTNPGYGSFTLCSTSSTSSYCSKVQSDFGAVDRAQGKTTSSPELLAEWPRIWSSHIRMRHQEGSIFRIDFTALFPKGYGKDKTPFETGEDIGTSGSVAEFVVEDGKVVGFGISGLVGQLTERARVYKSVQDRAEVWFDKVRG